MAWEKFTQRGSRFSPPRVNTTRSGLITVNRGCYDTYFGGKKHAVLWFDSDTGRIGIEPSDRKSIAYPVRRNGASLGYTIHGTTFMKRHGILPKKSRVYDVEWDDALGMIIATPVKATSGNPPSSHPVL